MLFGALLAFLHRIRVQLAVHFRLPGIRLPGIRLRTATRLRVPNCMVRDLEPLPVQRAQQAAVGVEVPAAGAGREGGRGQLH